jgi:hypothetical protein
MLEHAWITFLRQCLRPRQRRLLRNRSRPVLQWEHHRTRPKGSGLLRQLQGGLGLGCAGRTQNRTKEKLVCGSNPGDALRKGWRCTMAT